jgi:type II secretory pathway pseudopilin PulG
MTPNRSRPSQARSPALRAGEPGAAGSAIAGFSMIEATIASAILLIVAIGILPMFTLAISNNQQGRDSMEITNQARSELERLYQLGFADPELAVPAGETQLRVEAYFTNDEEGWVPAAEYDGEGFVFHRIVTVRQFEDTALEDGLLHPDEAIDGGGAAPVHFKEILVEVESAGSIGAPARQVALRGIRAV